MVKVKSQAHLDADARYEASREQVLIRLTKAEADAIDAAKGDKSRQQYMKAKALAAAKRAR